MIYFDSNYAEIEYDEIKRITTVKTKGYMTSEQYRDYCEKLLQCLVKHQCSKAIFDNRIFITIRPEDQQWLKSDFNPRLDKQFPHLKYALLLPENMIQKNILNKMATNENSKVFSNLNEAITWLNTFH